MVYAVGKRKCLDHPTKNVVDGLWLMELAYRFALDRLFRERGNVQVRKPQNQEKVNFKTPSSVRLPDNLTLCELMSCCTCCACGSIAIASPGSIDIYKFLARSLNRDFMDTPSLR
jgi:hypothetical protein